MPACTYGARPAPGSEDVQLWIDRFALTTSVADIIRTYAPLAWASIAASLVSIEGICAENPDPPEPITAADIIAQTASTVTANAIGDSAVIDKAYAWLRYQQFLNFCDCNEPPSTPGNNCTGVVAPFTLPSLGSVSAAFPITVDQSLIDSIPVQPDGAWTWFYRAHATISGAATTGNDLFVEYLASNGVWVDTTADLLLFNSRPDCWTFNVQASVPKFGVATAVRVRNGAGGSYTVTGFEFCWCAFAPTPPPLPVQPPLTGTPVAPALACATEDLCAMVTELAHRLTIVAAQISDIQASLVGTDQLQELSSLSISGEGQIMLALGTRAVSVELTELGDNAFTSALGNPRGLMRVGSLRWFDGVGYSPRRFIDADRYNETRPTGALAVSWQLLPGTSGILKFLG